MALFVFKKDKTMKRNNKLLKMILSALFLALAYVMPFITGRLNALPNAYTRIALWLYLWMALGLGSRLYCPRYAFSYYRRISSYVSYGYMYGL